MKHGVVTDVGAVRTHKIQNLDVITPAFEERGILVKQTALGQKHRQALVGRVEQVGLHHAFGLAAAGAGDDEHIIVDLRNLWVHAVRPFRAVTKDQGVVVLLPGRLLLQDRFVLRHRLLLQFGGAFLQDLNQILQCLPSGGL